MKKLTAILFIAALFAAPSAYAQAPQLGAGQVMGNSTAAQRPGRAEALSAMFDRAFCATANSALARISGSWACLASANNGVWVTSAGGVPSISSTLPSAVQDNISFTQTGSNTVAVAMRTKLQDFVSVTDFGAVCDAGTGGTTIDTTAIQNAVNQVSASQGRAALWVPRLCNIDAPIVAPNSHSITIKCAGPGNVGSLGGGGFQMRATTGKVALDFSQGLFTGDLVTVEDCSFPAPIGAGGTGAGNLAIKIVLNSAVQLNRVRIDGYRAGITTSDSYGTSITNSFFTNILGIAIDLYDGVNPNCNAAVLTGNRFFANGVTLTSPAIRCQGSGVEIAGNDLEGNYIGAQIRDSFAVDFRGNYLEQNNGLNSMINVGVGTNGSLVFEANQFANGAAFGTAAFQFANITGLKFANNVVSNFPITFASTCVDCTVGANTLINGATIAEPPYTAVGAFTNSWASDGTVVVGYKKDDASGQVCLRGKLTSGTPGAVAFTLPAQYRPGQGLYYAATDGAGVYSAVFVAANGQVSPKTAADGNQLLGGICFQGVPS